MLNFCKIHKHKVELNIIKNKERGVNMDMNLDEVLVAVEGSFLQKTEENNFEKICIDTRKVNKGDLFIALNGQNFNSNKFVKEAFENGANTVIIDEVLYNEEDVKKRGNIIKVDNCHKALLNLANYYRRKLGIKVIGVTGSTGKTSTKDLIAALLSDKYNVFKTKGNFNNEIGLPLMVFQLTKEHDIAILEMGMSDLGEIDRLAKTAVPDIAVITNIGLSHLENLKTQENILKAKMEITNYFDENNLLVLNAEDKFLKEVNSSTFKVKKIGYNDEYDIFADNIILKEDITKFKANSKKINGEFVLPMAGKHNVLNCMLAIEVANALNVTYEEMIKGLNNLEATSMRLEIIKNDNITIINDCYNASPDSMKSSLDVLASYSNGRKVAILGDMYELGTKTKEAHEEIGFYAKDKVDLLIAIGENIEEFKKGYKNNNIIIFDNKEKFISEINKIINKNDILLIKASRGMKFEEIINELQKITV